MKNYKPLRKWLLYAGLSSLLFIGCGQQYKKKSIVPPYPEPIYLRGSFFESMEGTASWDICDDRNRMRFQGRTSYQVKLQLMVGFYEFKIADDTWTWVNLGAFEPEEVVEVDKPHYMTEKEPSPNLSFDAPEDGTYLFTLYAGNRGMPVLIVKQDADGI